MIQGGEKKGIWRNNGWRISRFDDSNEPTEPRNSINLKHMKHDENYIKGHQNLIS